MITFSAYFFTALISGSIGAVIMAIFVSGKTSRLEEERDLLEHELTAFTMPKAAFRKN